MLDEKEFLINVILNIEDKRKFLEAQDIPTLKLLQKNYFFGTEKGE